MNVLLYFIIVAGCLVHMLLEHNISVHKKLVPFIFMRTPLTTQMKPLK